MKQQRKSPVPEFCDLRLDPQRRLCPKFDAVSIADFPWLNPGRWGSGWWTTARRNTFNKEKGIVENDPLRHSRIRGSSRTAILRQARAVARK